MTNAPSDVLWSREPAVEGDAAVHALVIGVSRYDHLLGGTGEQSNTALLAGLGQLSAAATSATRVACWLRDNFDYPRVQLGSVRLLASPSSAELPLPGNANPPRATYAEVKKSMTAWRRLARANPKNIALLFVAGHGIQTSKEGGIALLQDVGHPDSELLDRALDVAAIRLGMVGDPNDPTTSTPSVQYYFFDACRVAPAALINYEELKAGLGSDISRGPAADMSWVLWGSRSRDNAWADPETKTTLFSQALVDCLASKAPADPDGRTVRFAPFQWTLEALVEELATNANEQQTVVPGGCGQLHTPVCLRPPATQIEEQQPQRKRRNPFSLHPLRGRPARLVTVNTPSRAPQAMTIRGSGVLIEELTERPVKLSPGRYSVVVEQPWGGSAQDDLFVPWGLRSTEILISVPDQPAGSPAGSARLASQLGLTGGASSALYLRFLTWTPDGLEYRSDATKPRVEVDHLDDDTVSLIMRAQRVDSEYVQLATDDGRSLVVALPISAHADSSQSCWLHVRVSKTALGAVVRFNDPLLDTCAGYLTGGRPDHVVKLGQSAQQILHREVEDPVLATMRGYALLKLNDLDNLHDWANNTSTSFDWLPDVAVIAGEVAARGGADARAAELFQIATRRGLPLFCEGLSLFANRLPQLLTDEDLDKSDRDLLRELAEQVLTVSPLAEFGALATTLRMDVDPGPINSDRGWRQFVRTSQPKEPQDFWKAP